MIVVTTLSYLVTKSTLVEQRDVAFGQLLNEKSERLHSWLSAVQTDIQVLAASKATQDAIVAFHDGWLAFESDPQETLQ